MSLLVEKDFGTKASISDKNDTLEIDGNTITVPEGTSVMRAANEAGISIPKLCASDNLDAFGSCRMCVCKVEGRKGMPASCTCLLYTSPSPRDATLSRMPSSA